MNFLISGRVKVNLDFQISADSIDDAELKAKEMVKGLLPNPLLGSIVDIDIYADEDFDESDWVSTLD